MKVLLLTKEKEFEIRNAIKLDFDLVTFESSLDNEILNFVRSNEIDVIVLHSSFKKNCYFLIESLVNICQKKTIYISTCKEYGFLYNVLLSPLFLLIDDLEIISLGTLIQMMEKYLVSIKRLEQKLEVFEEKVKEEEMIKKAKLFLMKEKGLSEQEAHKLIQKKSMNERISKRKAAERIIKGY